MVNVLLEALVSVIFPYDFYQAHGVREQKKCSSLQRRFFWLSVKWSQIKVSTWQRIESRDDTSPGRST